jgi:predicted dehydrogenase
MTIKERAKIAVVGAGWWAQGWHLPALDRNEHADLVAIVDSCLHPKSNSDLEPLPALKEKYEILIFSSVDDMLREIGSTLDGVIIATPHASHYEVGRQVILERNRRIDQDRSDLHILMEKPMTTDINHAVELYKLVENHGGESKFWINHTASYRIQAKLARSAISSGRLGRIRHITAFFAAPLKWLFDDPANRGWNEPSDGMLGNGFAWGQSSHLFAFLYHICPNLQPVDVFCTMAHSEKTGADISHSATIRCSDGKEKEYVVMSVSGTSLLPGSEYSDPPISKRINIEVFGDEGSLCYKGNDRESSSGRLEIRRNDGSIEVLHETFHFENTSPDGLGPESLQLFVQLCCGNWDRSLGSDVMEGLRSIQTIDAMYRSHKSHKPERCLYRNL